MAIQVKGYTRHVNGKLVTVRGYDVDGRNPQHPAAVRKVRQIPRMPMAGVVAPSGTHTVLSHIGLTRGLTAYMIYPSGRIGWKLTRLPIHGAYHIPTLTEVEDTPPNV